MNNLDFLCYRKNLKCIDYYNKYTDSENLSSGKPFSWISYTGDACGGVFLTMKSTALSSYDCIWYVMANNNVFRI